MSNDLTKRRDELIQKAHELAREFDELYSDTQEKVFTDPECFAGAPYMAIVIDRVDRKVDFLKFKNDKLRTGIRTEPEQYARNDLHVNVNQSIFIEGSAHAGLSLRKV